jgi:hypothetical protein
VPFVTPWTGESTTPPAVRVTDAGVAYEDAVLDALARDVDGVLWTVCGGTMTGRPEYTAELHPERQKTAMDLLLCAGCKEPVDRSDLGVPWVLPLRDAATDTRWEGVHSAIPPMCTRCSKVAPRFCPVLRRGYVELRVKEAEQIGVRGTLYPRPGEDGAPDPEAFVRYDSRELPFVVARQAVRELCRVTVVAFGGAIP